ncbi:hypothetical protein [Pseudomonas gingeri]|jgi:hypothetical protein|uniref:RiboL-PSP-HEPN domain-containing protein n=1 Tax=Pseudomonas gingeri TaxID=117681 RepID=A0A7Y7XVC9_9PSED|nr:hypothetical protein [Pseudomonas gingeri]NWC13020.1 hypothetical protein [Pseudomonas gingeri]
MSPEKLIELRDAIEARHVVSTDLAEQLQAAPAEIESEDHNSDAIAEALFLRVFTAYESDVEKIFLHYVTGGASLQGARANSYLSITDETAARKLTKGALKFLSWAKPDEIKRTAEIYLENGWPIAAMMSSASHYLADCERVRNRIAHNSIEAMQQFNTAQRNLLATERLFTITPGQFLRIRNPRLRQTHIALYFNTLYQTLDAMLDPPQ